MVLPDGPMEEATGYGDGVDNDGPTATDTADAEPDTPGVARMVWSKIESNADTIGVVASLASIIGFVWAVMRS
jgi:hypothetical protein